MIEAWPRKCWSRRASITRLARAYLAGTNTRRERTEGGQGQGPGDGSWRRQKDGDSDDDAMTPAVVKRTLYVLLNGGPAPREVTTGLTDGRVTEITGENSRKVKPSSWGSPARTMARASAVVSNSAARASCS